MKRARARPGTSAGHSPRSSAWPTAACCAGGYWTRAVAAGNTRCWPPPGARTWWGWTSRRGPSSRRVTRQASGASRVRFEVADALSLDGLGLTFDTVIDSGLFHVFDDADRARYVTSLASVLESGGTCYLMCFSERQPGAIGPRRVRQEELRAAFSDGWGVTSIVADAFEVNPGLGTPTAQAWLATIRRT